MKKSISQVAQGLNFNPDCLWNPDSWKKKFMEVSKLSDGKNRRIKLHELRTLVFLDTVNIVRKGFYKLPDGKRVDLHLNPNIEKQTVFCESEIRPLIPDQADGSQVFYQVIEGDCLDIAHRLVEKNGEDQVCILNFANWKTPGGGVLGGAGAQEEYLFRCSDYFRSLYQYSDFYDQYGLSKNQYHSYPLNENFGGVFSRGVTVFRKSEEQAYAYYEKPWKVNFIAAAAHRNPPIENVKGEDRLVESEVTFMKNKVRTILRIALRNGQKVLVLGALGCGAFHNPPKHVAEIFKSVLKEKEFYGVFDRVYFAIKEDHNSNGVNYDAFKQVFFWENVESSDAYIGSESGNLFHFCDSSIAGAVPCSKVVYCPVSDSNIIECILVSNFRKKGFMTLEELSGIYRIPIYVSIGNPLIYDDVEFLSCNRWGLSLINPKAYVLVCKNGQWGAFEVYGNFFREKKPELIIPIKYTKAEVKYKLGYEFDGNDGFLPLVRGLL